MNCNVANVWMHDYLDGELPRDDIALLQDHLRSCSGCMARFEQLERTEAMVFRTIEAAVPDAGYDAKASRRLNERILSQLPPAPRQVRPKTLRYLYRYPGLAVAAVFVLVMLGSFLAMWQQDTKLVVSGEDLEHVIIQGNNVIVPAGTRVDGNLIVENGSADVQGEVNGNVTVIDGKINLASTGHIIGQSRTISQALDWFWYKVTETFNDIAS
ncbi:zf-HC2 domain-containing protein [Paenibacillus protaetiae]|uniref:Anti-sigma-W factor RsiW n=1 Tax=Paenibacillus protaetiae TaxID=2509456 RepID=A0A4P6F407_9BACL|nr:zf-HC2 domain-containing protein [Paenibacillus protaetiae]QAY67907.1 anti-sigma factor [Paenibacillus protaetiae]